ncbi:MAG: cytidine/deoxycytidylate deaminase family protein [Spirochaetes bacterium]|nr:cytidine/deoxycytidylate deaminase family protein [Spirochaetota bacterium]
MNRPDWNRYFIDIAVLVASRSTCMRRSVGAVIVREKRIIATGYNGAPAGLKHCEELGGCLRQKLGIPSGERHEICRATHAEQNAIIQAARHGTDIDGSDLYCTHQPCSLCAKMIINAGIKRIFFVEGYPDEFALSFLKEAGIELTKV